MKNGNLSALVALVRKDLQIFVHDRRAMILAFLVPIAIASFFGYLFGGNGGKDRETGKIEIRAIDQDGTTLSRAVVAGLGSDPLLSVRPATLEEGREAVRKGKAAVAIVLPKGFGDAAARSLFDPTAKKPVVGMLHDPSHVGELAMVRGMLTQHAMEAVSAEAFNGPTGEKMLGEELRDLEKPTPGMTSADQESLRQLLSGALDMNRRSREPAADGSPNTSRRGLGMPFEISAQEVTAHEGVQYNGYAHSFAGMGVQFVLFAAIDLGVAILLERQKGIWKRLRGAPVSRGMLLLGKALSAAFLGLLTFTVMFTFAFVVFGVHISGSFLGFVAVAISFALMAAAFGLMIASVGKTPQAARGISSLAVLLLVMLGGAWVPSFIFPKWLQTATLVTPTRWAVDGFDAMTWRGVGFSGALAPIGVLLLSAAIFGAIAWNRFRWEE
jgi:ABC-2 type transport system permease protein